MGTFLIFIFLLIVLALFAIENQEVTTVRIPFHEVYEIPKMALILFSVAVGFVGTFFVFLARDTRKFIDNWQFVRKQKRDVKVQDLYSKALNSLLSHDEDGAKGALEGILKVEPGHVNTLLRLGDIAADAGDYHKANNYYQKAKNINPQNYETLFALVHLMEKTERWSEALKFIEEILDIDSANLTALYKKRSILEKQGRWDDVVYLQKSILKHEHTEKDKQRENRNLIGYHYEYGRDSLENNQLEKAKKTFKTVLRMEKDFIPATLGIAEVMLREGNNEDAINFLEKNYEQTSSKIILARLEDLLIGLGEPARLIGIYKNSISKDPNNQATKFFLGKLYYRLEMIDDAFEILSSMDVVTTAYPEFHQLMGDLYMRRNEPEKAVEEFRHVLDVRKSLRLSYCCSHCGHTSEEWAGRCPDCKQWTTFSFHIEGSCKR